jgi:hypothetical protein
VESISLQSNRARGYVSFFVFFTTYTIDKKKIYIFIIKKLMFKIKQINNNNFRRKMLPWVALKATQAKMEMITKISKVA